MAVMAIAVASLSGAAATATADDGDHGAAAFGNAVGSPGILSGNVVQVPIYLPIEICGNNVSILSALDGALGNVCVQH
ncbi:hypothetical protein GCM10009838_85370 [Catenulispora subtropica]|uniref:Chaplin domain-containing protein n=2 Tax=Catenulispora subtropica TaxID=450798 RepID=A0ABN2TEI5_9ACTN